MRDEIKSNKKLEQVSGGVYTVNSSELNMIMPILESMDLHVSKEFVVDLMNRGGLVLRHWALQASGNNSKANMIPSFDK